MNDYLATTIPNLHQQSKSNLVQVLKKYNGYKNSRMRNMTLLLS